MGKGGERGGEEGGEVGGGVGWALYASELPMTGSVFYSLRYPPFPPPSTLHTPYTLLRSRLNK